MKKKHLIVFILVISTLVLSVFLYLSFNDSTMSYTENEVRDIVRQNIQVGDPEVKVIEWFDEIGWGSGYDKDVNYRYSSVAGKSLLHREAIDIRVYMNENKKVERIEVETLRTSL